ncbi:hypothetical protein [Actinacidiphila glaucinigra]|uniref:Uncharacterized protein n=1 Tax=Actinacidiphila glaucinigra TaxID=235986 RepID=A0A239NCG2_9ACTN|nr:hypothetical protein [Actinacidiphila glaucinigra]SNT52601.1 hypothetical protein SAMN05216252_13425 [Actinacidiphila glaucinigra]
MQGGDAPLHFTVVDAPAAFVAVVEVTTLVVEDLVDADTAARAFCVILVDVGHDEAQNLERTRRGAGHPLAEDDRALGGGRGDVRHAKVVTGRE